MFRLFAYYCSALSSFITLLHVQVEVHHQPKQQYKKWKRSAEDAEEELGADLDGSSRKERSLLTAAVGLGALGAANTAGFVGGAHVGKKVGLAAGLAISGGLSKRSAMDSEAEDMGEDELGDEQEGAVMTAEDGEVVEGDVSSRKERSLLLKAAVGLGALGAAKFAGAVTGAHIGKKLGLGAGLAVGLAKKKIAAKKTVKATKAVHHKQHFKTEQVCKLVPFKQCTNNQVCEQVPSERCEKLPVKNCKQVPNTKCWTTPHEVCTTVTDTQCKNVPHESCHQVPKQRCVSVPHEVCVNVSTVKG